MKLILSFNKLCLVDMPLSKCISFPLFLHFLQVFDGWTILQPRILAEGIKKLSQECYSLELSERLWMDERDYAGYFLALRSYSHSHLSHDTPSTWVAYCPSETPEIHIHSYLWRRQRSKIFWEQNSWRVKWENKVTASINFPLVLISSLYSS